MLLIVDNTWTFVRHYSNLWEIYPLLPTNVLVFVANVKRNGEENLSLLY